VILGVLAGIDFFETDYPLDLASKNKALILSPQCPQVTKESLEHIRKQSAPALA
jgi:hypothetical protein